MLTQNIQVITLRDPKTNTNYVNSSRTADTDLCFFLFNKFQMQFIDACIYRFLFNPLTGSSQHFVSHNIPQSIWSTGMQNKSQWDYYKVDWRICLDCFVNVRRGSNVLPKQQIIRHWILQQLSTRFSCIVPRRPWNQHSENKMAVRQCTRI